VENVKAFALAAFAVILIAGLGYGSNALLDRYNIAAGPSGGACVDADGAKYNWPWANAPTLWPRCPPNPTTPAVPTQEK
jgi:hypothetical protein